jgi:hypothetical protein
MEHVLRRDDLRSDEELLAATAAGPEAFVSSPSEA